MHKLLQRQVRRLLGEDLSEVTKEFLEAVNAAYEQADEDRLLMERAMELTSEELLERNKALGRSLALLQATLESTDDGTLVVGPNGSIRSYNHAFVEIWDHPVDILERRDGTASLRHLRSQLVEPHKFDRRIGQLVTDPAAKSLDVLNLVNGKIIERHSQPIFHEGEILGRVWSDRDITEQRHFEETIRQSQKMEAIGQLAGGIAHDFNNILTVIVGWCDLARHAHPDSDVLPLINEIRLAGQRASGLTSQLLTFSRQEILEPEILDLNEVVSDLSELLHRLLSEDLSLVTRLDAVAPTIFADRTRLQQVVMNLVINARDAVQPGGTIQVSTEVLDLEDDGEPFPFGVESPGSYVVLRVQDDGIGIPEEIRARIFEPFFTTKDPGKGTGLGLATVYGIVRRFGGLLDLTSEAGEGSEFRLIFPKAFGQPRLAESLRQMPVWEPQTVLVVEDDPSVSLILEAILALWEVLDVHMAASPSDALALIEEVSPALQVDLLISDIVMPGMDGFELADLLAKRYPKLKTLFVSGYDPKSSKRLEEVRSRAGFLSKPFDFNLLGEKIHEVLASPVTYRGVDDESVQVEKT